MVSVVRAAPGFEAHASDYFSNGYRGIDDFLAETKHRDLMLFEPNSGVALESGQITCSQKERRYGKRGLFSWLLQQIGGKPIDYFEFGVLNCGTFNRVIESTRSDDARFYGFDTFEGLPEPWVRTFGTGRIRVGRHAGALKAEHGPAVYDERATLFKGLFQDTLPGALQLAFPAGRQPHRPLFVNIDSDLYSSALYVLTNMHSLLRSGDYVYFDEFFEAMNEFSAFNDYIRSYNSKSWFVPVARAYDGILFEVRLPALSEDATQLVDRGTTHFLDRMKAYARARMQSFQPYSRGEKRRRGAEAGGD